MAVNRIRGTVGNDSLTGTDGSDNIVGLAGNDTIRGGGGRDTIDGGEGDDRLYGDDGADTLIGGTGNDTIYAEGADTIHGGEGNDFVLYDGVVVAGTADGGIGERDAIGFYGALFDASSATASFAGFEFFAYSTASGQTLDGTTARDTIDLSTLTATRLTNGNEAVLTIQGGDGDDAITGGAERDVIYGDGGADRLNGGAGADVVYAYGADTIDGQEGDDTVIYDNVVLAGTAAGGAGDRDSIWFHDAFFGAASASASFSGIEYFYYSTSSGQELSGSEGADTLDLSSITATRTTNGGVAVVLIHGNGGDDTITGGAERDEIYGDAGADRLNGGAGNDVVYADGADVIDGGEGDDLVIYDSVVLAGTAAGGTGDTDSIWFHDAFFGAETASVSFSGIEYFYYSTSAGQALSGSEGADTLDLSSITATRTTNGGVATVLIHGNGGNDTITGGAERDVIYGDGGADRLNGGLGDDVIYAYGADTINGQDGDDVVIYDNVVLAGTAAGGAGDRDSIWFHNALFGAGSAAVSFSGIEYFYYSTSDGQDLRGSDGADRLDLSSITATLTTNGSTATVAISAGGGNDTITGGSERDTIYGEAGNDSLDGGRGLDTLIGGEGRDTFRFTAGGTGGRTDSADRITDFSQAERDRIDLSAIDANTGAPGVQHFSFIGTAAFGGQAGELRYFVSSGITYVAGDTDGDSVADLMIRVDGTPALAAADFILG